MGFYLFIFRNHFVSKFVYSWVMKANLKYGHFLDLHGSLKEISLYGQVIHDETPYWTACFTFFKSSSLAPETKTWKLNEYLAVGLFNAVSLFNAAFISLSHFEDLFFFFFFNYSFITYHLLVLKITFYGLFYVISVLPKLLMMDVSISTISF